RRPLHGLWLLRRRTTPLSNRRALYSVQVHVVGSGCHTPAGDGERGARGTGEHVQVGVGAMRRAPPLAAYVPSGPQPLSRPCLALPTLRALSLHYHLPPLP